MMKVGKKVLSLKKRLKALGKGKKISNTNWKPECYVHFKEDELSTEDGLVYPMKDLKFGTWFVWKEPKKESEYARNTSSPKVTPNVITIDLKHGFNIVDKALMAQWHCTLKVMHPDGSVVLYQHGISASLGKDGDALWIAHGNHCKHAAYRVFEKDGFICLGYDVEKGYKVQLLLTGYLATY